MPGLSAWDWFCSTCGFALGVEPAPWRRCPMCGSKAHKAVRREGETSDTQEGETTPQEPREGLWGAFQREEA